MSVFADVALMAGTIVFLGYVGLVGIKKLRDKLSEKTDMPPMEDF